MRFEMRLEQIQEDLAKGEANPHLRELKRLKKERARIEHDLKWISRSLKTDRRKHDHSLYWVKGFKDVRLWVIEQALKELEVEVNNALVMLGLKGWKIRFDVERETKSGGVSRGFSVFISSPRSPDSVVWEAWSGGETQRLKIAGAIGLSNLIASRNAIKPSLEVWDEPTQHLNATGVEDLLGFFRDRAESTGRQIFLVDHRSLDQGLFDGEYRVTKTRKGSTIERLS